MNKIICDICGTTYPDTADCCPICGYSNGEPEDLSGADISYEELQPDTEETAAKPVSTSRKKEIFDYDEVNTVKDSDDDEEDDEDDYDEEESEEAPRQNTFVIILLTVLIVVLLGVAGFIFVRYFLPNMGEEPEPTTVATQAEETTDPTTEPTVPCQQMGMLSAAVAELNAEGQQFLLHMKAFPENTTDRIIYTSADESIATVTEDGKITAVSEGETKIYISCGKVSMDCPVIVKFVEETVPPTTEQTIPAESVAEETTSDDTASETVADEENTDETAPAETTDAETDEKPAENKDNANLKDVTLKLKKSDIQLGVYYTFQLVLDCDLEPDEVTWSSEHPHIAKVDEQGNVTAMKSGTTAVTAKYGDQEVQCMIRCIWY